MLRGRSILVVMLLAALAAGGCSRSDREKEDESSSPAGGGGGPLIIPFAGQSSSTYSNINQSRPVRRFSGDVGVGSKASVTARGRSFFGFGSGS